MHRQLLDIILCPACGSALELAEATFATVQYEDGPRDEIENGTVSCDCGRRYPVTNFVLSFADLFSPDLQREAAYWDSYYSWLLEQGSYGFHDLRRGHAPYITQGITEPFPAADTLHRYDIHYQVADYLHSLGRASTPGTLLDIGVGLGWTSLHFARAGFSVTAFEPSLRPVMAAKRYAMQQGVFVEYLCAAMGAIAFRPGSFNNVTAFHSLHHVPNLGAELHKVRVWLNQGGALALDEHVGNSKLAASLGAEIHRWAEAEVFPGYRTLSPEVLARLPQEPHSALEDSSVSEVLPLVRTLFAIEMQRPRHTFLDHYPLLYYLHAGKNMEAYQHALTIANQVQELVRQIDPEGGDYVTIVARNSPVDSPTVIESETSLLRPHEQEELPMPPHESPPVEQNAADLEAMLARQAAWAKLLENELDRKNAEIVRLERLLKKIESGRVMRLLRRIHTSLGVKRR